MMDSKAWKAALVCAFLLIVGAAAWSVAGFERTLRKGQVVLLELAPVDPRALMQGDYMALRFAVDRMLPRVPMFFREAGKGADKQAREKPPHFAYLALDDQQRATWAGAGNDVPAPEGQVAMRTRMRDWQMSVGPNAFFFQEGTAGAYEKARWGEFRVASDGKALLAHLRDEKLQRIGSRNSMQ